MSDEFEHLTVESIRSSMANVETHREPSVIQRDVSLTNRAYRAELGLSYLADVAEHLLVRIERLEAKLSEHESDE